MNKRIKTETTYRTDFGIKSYRDAQIDSKSYLFTIHTYDEAGNQTGSLNYDPMGNVVDHLQFKFNSDNQIIEEINFFDEEITERKTIEYNSNGKILKEIIHYLDGSVDTVSYLYDLHAKLISKTLEDSDGEKTMMQKLTYKDNYLILDEHFDEYGELSESMEFTYNLEGKVKTLQSWSKSSNKVNNLEYSYNPDGERDKILHYNGSGQLIGRVLYNFNEKGLISETVTEIPGMKSLLKFEYDERGNEIHQIQTDDKDNVVQEIVRKFDEKDLLLESRVSLNKLGAGINEDYIVRFEYEFFN